MTSTLTGIGAADANPDLVDGPGPEPALGTVVEQAVALLSEAVEHLDPGRLSGGDARRLFTLFAGAGHLVTAGKTLLAPRIDDSGIWRDEGHANPARMLAVLEGIPTGQARSTLEVGRRLADLPGTEEAMRRGTLSGPKLAELSSAAVLDPAGETELLTGAGDAPLHLVRERCARSRANSTRNDPLAAERRIHAGRHFKSWIDDEGGFCFRGRDTAERGAKLLERLQHGAARLRADATKRANQSTPEEKNPPESTQALMADALYLLVTNSGSTLLRPDQTGPTPTSGSGPTRVRRGAVDDASDDDPGPSEERIATRYGVADLPPEGPPDGAEDDGRGPPGRDDIDPDLLSDVVNRPPTCSLMVRVDLGALLRGHTEAGERCELDDHGPIPVDVARSLASDSFLQLVFHEAGDIRAVSHQGRTINKRLRTALCFRDRGCVVPGCGVTYGLEIDHTTPVAEFGPTELDNLALLCHHHHYLKTFEGWVLARSGLDDDGTPIWTFTPQPPFGQEPEFGTG